MDQSASQALTIHPLDLHTHMSSEGIRDGYTQQFRHLAGQILCRTTYRLFNGTRLTLVGGFGKDTKQVYYLGTRRAESTA